MDVLKKFKQLFLDYLRENEFDIQPRELYAPANYIMNIGGKRMRPILVLLGANLFSETPENALPAAMAVELFHNFSLLHDDIMDEAPLRRGKPTVHIKFDTNSAILSGDVMMIWAYKFIARCNPAIQLQLLSVFNEIAIEVCEGQQFDLNFESVNQVEIEEYLNMIELKTAALLGGSLQLGALIGGANEKDAEHLKNFGRQIGMAFQLQDDMLDTFGDPEKFGKKVGGDIVQNKKTLLLIKSMELANSNQRKELDHWLAETANEEEKIKAVTSIYQQLDVKKYVEGLKAEYLGSAFENLNKINVADKKKEPIRYFAMSLMKREN